MKKTVIMDILYRYATCPVCQDSSIGNGSSISINTSCFERNCKCGWHVQGIVHAKGYPIELVNNAVKPS